MYKLLFFFSCFLIACFNRSEILHRPNMEAANTLKVNNMSNSSEKEPQKVGFHDFKMKSIDGETVDFATFKGEKLWYDGNRRRGGNPRATDVIGPISM